MGNRLITIVYNKADVSPTIYEHWANISESKKFLKEQFIVFADRKSDVEYFAGRLAGRLHRQRDAECCSFGLLNTPESIQEIVKDKTRWRELADYSHGDEGILLVNVDDFSFDVLDYNYFK